MRRRRLPVSKGACSVLGQVGAGSASPNFSVDQRDGTAPALTKCVITWRSGQDRRKIATHTWHEPCQLKSGNADLPVGGLHDAFQEKGVPGCVPATRNTSRASNSNQHPGDTTERKPDESPRLGNSAVRWRASMRVSLPNTSGHLPDAVEAGRIKIMRRRHEMCAHTSGRRFPCRGRHSSDLPDSWPGAIPPSR